MARVDRGTGKKIRKKKVRKKTDPRPGPGPLEPGHRIEPRPDPPDPPEPDPPDPPRPRPPRPIHVIVPDPPCPWSPRQLDAIVRRAVEFIRERQHVHAREIGWEIGEHLFLELYRGDEEYVRRLDPTKPDSTGDIARATGIPSSTLRLWLVASMVRHRLASTGRAPDLDLRHYHVLDGLEADIETLRRVAAWTERHDVSYRRLLGLVDGWQRFIDEGGSVEEILDDEDDPEPRPPRPRRTRTPRHVLLRARRMLRVVGRWWRASSISRDNAARLRARLLAIRSRLVEVRS